MCLKNCGWYDKVEEVLNRALEYQLTKLDEDALEVAKTFFHVGVCIRDSGRPEEAEPVLR